MTDIGRPWRRLRNRVLAETDICHICGQPGADSVDHIIPIAQRPDLALERTNVAPAHHNVPPHCNRRKGDRPMPLNILRRSSSLNRPDRNVTQTTGGTPPPPPDGPTAA